MNVYGASVGVWSFNEPFGIACSDASSYGNYGLLDNTSFRSADDAGRNYICLDGNSSYIDFGSSGVFDFSDAFTLEVWCRLNAVPSGEPFILGRSTSVYGLSYYLNGRVYFYGGDSGTNNLSYQISTGQWVHIVGTVDNKVPSGYNMFLYVNGTRVGYRRSANRPIVGSQAALVAGADYGRTIFLNADIDEIRIYNHALSQQDITANYAAGPGKVAIPCEQEWLYGTNIIGDLNYDCHVNFSDFAIFGMMWLSQQ